MCDATTAGAITTFQHSTVRTVKRACSEDVAKMALQSSIAIMQCPMRFSTKSHTASAARRARWHLTTKFACVRQPCPEGLIDWPTRVAA